MAKTGTNAMRIWMLNNVANHVDRRTGEVNLTSLAEACAHHFDAHHWLDDDTHEVWDLAIDVAEYWEANRA
jgi:hypothetical protein